MTTVAVTVNESSNAITVALSAEDLSDNTLSQLSDVTGTPTNNQILKFSTGTSKWSPATETVESVNTATGVVALSTTNITEGTNLYYTDVRADARITNAGSANWNTAYGWGNHASAGYVTATLTDEQVQDKAGAMFTGNTETLITATYQDADGTIDLVVDNDLSNYDNSTSAFLTSQTSHADVVQDGDFASQGIMLRGASGGTYSILADASANWNTAFGWGNHASGGYLTSIATDSINDTHIDWGTGTNQVSTADVPENTNLYYTDARARAALSASGDISYNSGTGVISFTNDAGDIESVTAGTGLTGGGTSGAVTLNVSGLTVSEIAGASLQTGSESFVDNDTSLMTSAAIQDKIEAYGYSTTTGDITGVTAGTGLSGGGTSATVTVNLANTAVTGASYGTATAIPAFTVDAQGRLTAASTNALSISTFDTDDLSEGSTNLYYTDTRARAVSLENVVEDTTPQLGGQLDVNGQALGDGTLELLKFTETGSAVNEFTIANAAADGAPVLSATGDDTDVGITLTPKGDGLIQLNGEVQIGTDATENISRILVSGDDLQIENLGTTGDIQIICTDDIQFCPKDNTQFFNNTNDGDVQFHAFGDGQSPQMKFPVFSARGKMNMETAGMDTAMSGTQDGDYLGEFNFYGHTGNTDYGGWGGFIYAANVPVRIRAKQDGTVSGNNIPGSIEFTTSDNSGNYYTGLKLRANGDLQLDQGICLKVKSDPSTKTDYAHVYAKDDSGSAEVFVRDEAGNVTQISPHNEDGDWEFFSRNTNTGKTVRVNMERMIRDIETLTGNTYIEDE